MTAGPLIAEPLREVVFLRQSRRVHLPAAGSAGHDVVTRCGRVGWWHPSISLRQARASGLVCRTCDLRGYTGGTP